MTNAQARFVAAIRREGGVVTSRRLLPSGDLNVQWTTREGEKLAQNVKP